MREVHILKGPIWNGEADSPKYLGVAHFRLVDSIGIPHKGNILVWCDYKIKDKNDPEGHLVPMWKYPFIIKCADAVKYPVQILGDYNRTRIHIIPVDDMKVYQTKRKRCQTQADFESIKIACEAVKKEQEIKKEMEQ
jgi:hypothetical protein